jgi:hypothetical protein
MTVLGLVEDVRRTMYRDDAFNKSKYPLDDKIELLKIDDNRSRYTQMFAWNTAKLYAELTEEDAASTLTELVCIEIDKTQVAKVAQAVAENYVESVDTGAHNGQSDTECTEETAKDMEEQPCANVDAEGFLAEKLKELDANPDRDAIIQAAVDGRLDGAEGAETTLSALYLSSDGTGVPGLRRELSDKHRFS